MTTVARAHSATLVRVTGQTQWAGEDAGRRRGHFSTTTNTGTLRLVQLIQVVQIVHFLPVLVTAGIRAAG